MVALSPSRHVAIDALRGTVMAIMALDHVRDFFHAEAMRFRPEDLTQTTGPIFLTRWITHVCAPVFFLLAGAGAALWLSRGTRTPRHLSWFLLTRGLWLMLLEVTALRFGFFLSLTSGPLLLTVLWTLGLSMIALAALCHLPRRALWIVAIAAILLHNLADPVRARDFGAAAWAWNLLHQPGAFLVKGVLVIITYPLVPWFAVMALGFCIGVWYRTADETRRQRALLGAGLSMSAAFVLLRTFNVYGDPSPWSAAAPEAALWSFLNTTKYPPSLLFLLMTLGPALVAWSWLDRHPLRRDHPLVIIGRVPLFFFVLHFLVAHLLAFPFAWWRYGRTDFLWTPMPTVGGPTPIYPADFGCSLPATYGVWLLVLVICYPLCIWMARLKERRRAWWVGYL